VVRVGGGYIKFEDYFEKNHKLFYNKIKDMMRQENKSFH
jgi:hypothetical protein